MRVSRLLSLGALLTSTIAITSTIVLTPVEQSSYYYLGCYPYTAETAIGAYDIPNIATGYNNGNPVDCRFGCDQQFNAPYVFMYGTYCYCQVREVEFDIHQPGSAPVDNSLCTTPCFADPNAPSGTLSNTEVCRGVREVRPQSILQVLTVARLTDFDHTHGLVTRKVVKCEQSGLPTHRHYLLVLAYVEISQLK